MVNLEENERRWDGLYLDSIINDHFLAYVGGPRFVNPTFYSLANDFLSVCIGVASILREALANVFFLKNGHSPLHFHLHQYYGRTRISWIYTFLCIDDAKFPKLTGG